MKPKLFTKKEITTIGQKINDQRKRTKGYLKQIGEVVLKWIVILIYIVLLIYFVFKPLTEFMFMVEYNIKVGLLKYFVH